jgi:hypothetical protein
MGLHGLRHERHVCALSSKRDGNCLTDASAGSGDDDLAPGQVLEIACHERVSIRRLF